MSLEVGKKAPNFSYLNSENKKTQLSDLFGPKGLILYFYPRDNTPGCTTEACDFRDSNEQLKKLGFNIAGISKDNLSSHNKFIEKFNLNFELIPDTDHSICELYGVWQEKKFMGKTSMGIVRTTFVLDNKGKILKIYPNVKVKDHVIKITEDLKKLGDSQ
jgi:thioredoxin-dependent peroxiredoxin